jgi:hypothetical protein
MTWITNGARQAKFEKSLYRMRRMHWKLHEITKYLPFVELGMLIVSFSFSQ